MIANVAAVKFRDVPKVGSKEYKIVIKIIAATMLLITLVIKITSKITTLKNTMGERTLKNGSNQPFNVAVIPDASLLIVLAKGIK